MSLVEHQEEKSKKMENALVVRVIADLIPSVVETDETDFRPIESKDKKEEGGGLDE